MTRIAPSLVVAAVAGLVLAGCDSSNSRPSGPGPATALVVVAQPVAGSAGQPLADLVVEARDAAGNVVASPAAVTVSLLSSPAGAVLLGVTSAPATSGAAATLAGLSVERAGPYQLRVSSGALQVDGAPFTVGAGAAAALAIATSPAGPVTAGDGFGATVEIRDAFGNLVASDASVTLALSPDGVLRGAAQAGAAAGVASFSALSIQEAGSYALVATSGALTPSAPSASFTVVPGAPARLAFTVSPAAAGTAGTVLTPAAVVAVQDAFGNAVAAGSDQVSLALGGGNAAALLGGTTTDATVLGAVTFADLTVDRAGVGYHLVASAAGLTSATSGDFAIAAAVGDPATSTVVATPTTQTVGEDVLLTATVLDFFGNPVEATTVTFATSDAGATFVQPPATDASGVATGSFTSTVAGATTVQASIGAGPAFSGTATVTFDPGPPSAVASTLVATPATVQADGIAAISLVATVKDEFANPVPGAIVTLSSSGTATFVQPGPTDAAGVATGAVTATVIGAQDLTASVGATPVAGTTVTFTTTDPDGDGIPDREDAFPDDPTRFASYATVILPGLGGTFTTATAINASNSVVGLSEDGTGSVTGAVWTVSGSSADPGESLPPIAGNAYSAAYGVDASGAVVGESEKGAAFVPVLWAPGASAPSELALGSFSPPAAAYGIAGARIVGEAAQGTATVAVLWADPGATPVALATLGGDHSAAYAVAGSLVVGESSLPAPGSAGRAAAWTLDASGNAGPAVALAPLAGHVSSIALGVDAGGLIVGESVSATGVVHAVHWTLAAPNAPVDFGPGGASGVNAGGRVAGHAGVPVGPVVWDVRNPALLEGVIDPPFTFSQAYGINGANVVVGLLDGEAFAAVPVPAGTP